MKRVLLPVAVLVGLSACGQGVADDELKPGNWKMTGGMSKFEVPGATEEQAKLFQDAAGKMISQEQCIPAGENKFNPDIIADAMRQSGECTIKDFDLTDGVIKGNMTCDVGGGKTTDVDIDGTISSEAFAMAVETEMLEEALPGGKASVTVEMKGEWIGDC